MCVNVYIERDTVRTHIQSTPVLCWKFSDMWRSVTREKFRNELCLEVEDKTEEEGCLVVEYVQFFNNGTSVNADGASFLKEGGCFCSGMWLDSRIDLIADLGVDLKIAVLLNNPLDT